MESSVVPSPGGSSSPITSGIAAGTPTVTVPVHQRLSLGLEMFGFGKSEGFLRKETDEVPLAVAGVHDEYQLITVLWTPEAPQVQVVEATGTSKLDKLYEPEFQRLDRNLAALMESKGQEKAQAIQRQVCPSVDEGKVAELGVVGSGSGGELVFGSELVYRKAGKGK